MNYFKKAFIITALLTTAFLFTGCGKDVINPVISGTGNFTFEVNQVEPNWLLGITATDDKDGDLTSMITADDSDVNLSVVGTYSLTYRVSDRAGNYVTQTVNVVVQDTTDPEISNTSNFTLEVNSAKPNWLLGITATDNYDGILTSSITVDDSDVDLTTVGVYTLTYTVEDQNGNEKSVIVNVTVQDTTAPEILGTDNFVLEVDSVKPNWLADITATDNYDGILTSSITVDDSDVDLTTVGVYTLTYTVEDQNGNEKSVTVNVTVQDTTDPEISNTSNFTLEVDSVKPNWLLGITATDNYDGILTSSITVDDSNVDLTTVGVYTLTYTVEDQNGNEKSVTVNVTVQDTTAPEILGAQNLEAEANSTPNWLLGITATDNYDGDLTASIVVDHSNVDLTKLGDYELTYSIVDSHDNSTRITIQVSVVFVLTKTYIDTDIALLTELLGVTPSTETLLLIKSVSALRAENYGMLYVPGTEITVAGVQSKFVRELTEEEAQLILSYINYWMSSFQTPAQGIAEYAGQRIMMSFILGRSFTEAESEILSVIGALTNTYNGLMVQETDPTFEEATVSKIETIIGRSLTTEETDALAKQNAMKMEMMSKMMMIMASQQVKRDLTLEEIKAFNLMIGAVIALQVNGGTLPSLEEAQSTLGVTFTAEQIAAYGVILNLYDDILFNMVLDQIKIQWGREATEEEIVQLRVYVALMFEYQANYTQNTDPEFQNASISQIEIVIGRSLTQEELYSVEFMTVQSTVIMLENSLGRSLTQEEKLAVPVILNLEKEYLAAATGTDPQFEAATDEQIATVLNRALTQEELDSLFIFRYLMSQTSND